MAGRYTDAVNRLLRIQFILLGILGTIMLSYLSFHYTVGISPDSVAYISVARHLNDGTGFICYDDYFYVLQAPLYPLLLAITTSLTSADPVYTAGYLNAILFGLIIYFSGILFSIQLKSGALALLGTAAILFSSVIIQSSLIALSEPLFILLSILSLIFFENYRNKRNIQSLIALSVVVSLACLTRYIGIVLVLCFSLSLISFVNNSTIIKLKHLIVFLAVALIPAGLWVARNYYFTGTLVGQRAASVFSFSDNFFFMFQTLFQWFSYRPKSRNAILIKLPLMFAVIFTALIAIRKLSPVNRSISGIGTPLTFIILYSLLILYSATTTAVDKIDNRLLAPLFLPLLLLILLLTDKTLFWLRTYANEGVISIIILLEITMWIKYQVRTTEATINKYIDQNGTEYSSKPWKNNTVIEYLNENRDLANRYTFYSNIPEAVYLLANIKTRWSPPKTQYNSPVLISTAPDMDGLAINNKDACIVWFNTTDRNFLFSLSDLKQHTTMKRIALLKDGEIYTVTHK